MAAMETILSDCIDQIWDQYDTDKSGALSKEECKAFIMSTAEGMPLPMPSKSNEKLTKEEALKELEADFETCF